MKVSVLLQPSHTTLDALFDAWSRLEDLGVDGLWVNDHFFPMWGEPVGSNFEALTLLTAMALRTSRVTIGTLVVGAWYRNPHLLADMARTIDHLSGGRVVLGIGAGWSERDLVEYEYGDPSRSELSARFRADLPRVVGRLAALDPPPVRGRLPLLIGGVGETVTLPLVARYADVWNAAVNKFATVDEYRAKAERLAALCCEAGRDPAAIERTLLFPFGIPTVDDAAPWADAGIGHVIVTSTAPFDDGPVAPLLRWAHGHR